VVDELVDFPIAPIKYKKNIIEVKKGARIIFLRFKYILEKMYYIFDLTRKNHSLQYLWSTTT
jgi:hypothetical protein